jgi:hypothetical protein
MPSFPGCFQPKVAIHNLTTAAGEHGNLKAEFAD